MKFTVTEQGTFRRCKRQTILTSKNGLHLTPLLAPLSLATGSIVHAGHQHWLLEPTKSLHLHTLDASVAAQTHVRERYKKHVGVYPSDGEMGTLLEAVEFALAMAENYQLKWGQPLPDGMKILQPEQKIQVPVPGTEHECFNCETWLQKNIKECPDCHGTGAAMHVLEGKLDGLVQDTKTGLIYILEHKTYAQRPRMETLAFNDQFLSYTWLVDQLGINVDGAVPHILYDGMWRRAKVPRGRTFEDMFARYDIARTRTELDDFTRYCAQQLNEMAALYTAGLHSSLAYPNRQWMGCWDCKVKPICDALTRHEDHNAVISIAFTERSDDADEHEIEDDAETI